LIKDKTGWLAGF